jgi:hypothetical protein
LVEGPQSLASSEVLIMKRKITKLIVGGLLAFAAGVGLLCCTTRAATFIEPTLWNVGDLNSTYQEWTAGGTNAQPVTGSAQLVRTTNPVLATAPLLSQTGAFIAGSGGLYSFSGPYTVTAQIPNHSVVGATGTYILVQAASTMNPDYDPEGNETGGSVLRDSIKIYDAANQLLDTSLTAEVTRTFYAPNYPLFGGVGYEEVAWQVFVPGLVGDFKVTADVMVHAGVQAVRVDSIVAAGAGQPGDFDGDGDVDGADFVNWQTNFPIATGAMPGQGDADGDGDVDGADFVVWQTNFPFTPGGGASPIPEPHAVMLLALGGFLALFRRRLSRRV